MFVQVDNRAHDIIESDTEAKVSLFEFEDEEISGKGVKIVAGNTVILIHTIEELAHEILRITESVD